MRKDPRKEKVIYIAAGMLFVLLAAALMVLLLLTGDSKDRNEDASPMATVEPTATPEPNTVTIAGKAVDPLADAFDLSSRTLTAEDRAILAGMENLTTLSLSKCALTDLSFLSGMTKLTTLYLPENAITDLSVLSGLTNLRTLYLDKNPLVDLAPLAGLPSLSTLSLKGVSVADYVLEDLQKALPNCRIYSDSTRAEARPISIGGLAFTEDVEVLDLSNRGVFDISKLSYCLKLRDLDLTGNPVENFGVLSGLTKLEMLDLKNTNATDATLDILRSLQNLTWLDLSQNGALTAEKLDELKAALPNCLILHDKVYYTVELGGQTFTSDTTGITVPNAGIVDISRLNTFTELRYLILNENAIRDITALSGMTWLKELDLSENMLTDISPLSGHRELKQLNLSSNSITDVYALSSCIGLEKLDLSYNDLDYLSHLNSCLNLYWLDLTGNPRITAEQILRLQEVLPYCTIITDINLTTPTPEPTAEPLPQVTPEPEAVG